MLRGDKKLFHWGEAQEAAFLKITMLFTSGKTPILWHYDPDQPALLETDASDFAIAEVLSQKFEHDRLWPIGFVSRKLSPAELNYDIFNKEMVAVVHAHRKWTHFLQGAQHKTIIYSDHWNLIYFKTAVKLNCRQSRWAQELEFYDFDLYYQKGSSNSKADALSRCPEFTSREGGTTAAHERTLLRKEQRLEVGAMEIDNIGYEVIQIGVIDFDQRLPEAKE